MSIDVLYINIHVHYIIISRQKCITDQTILSNFTENSPLQNQINLYFFILICHSKKEVYY